MPDHVHLVLEGRSETADLCRSMDRWKQMTGYWHQRQNGCPLWMSGYHDHVLRDHESVVDYVRYVLENPVKAGLAKQVGEYRFAGSDVFSDEEIREMVRSGPDEQG
jgi:putative transposase